MNEEYHMKIAVLVPCYNEAHTIKKVVQDFSRILPEADIYVYDNNSTDGTDRIARDAGAIVRYEYRQGKGNVIRSMFRDIDANCYVMVDGDDTYPAENAREMVDLIVNRGSDMVIGDRLSSTYFTENKRPFHNTGNILVRKLVNSFFKGNIKDIMTGYRAFSPLFVKGFPVLSKGFEIETEMTIHALDNNLRMDAVPVEYRDRSKDSMSKLNTYSDGFKVVKTIFRLYKDYKPLKFFGIISVVLILIGCAFLIPVLITYAQIGLVPQLPRFITSTVFFLLAVLSLVCGLILDTVSKKNKQMFEVQLNIIAMLTKRNNKNLY
jgi:glycosyltransferase involved in cell wall biosynthesis